MGLAPYGEPRYVDRILDASRRPRPRRLVPAGHAVLRLPLGPDDDEPALRRAVRRARRGSPSPRSPSARWTSPLDPGGHRGDRAAHGAARGRVDRRRERVPRGRRRAELRGQRAAAPRGAVRRIWVQPAAGDAGGAIGAALYGWHQILRRPREVDGVHDRMQGAYLGPAVRERRDRRPGSTNAATRTSALGGPADAPSASRELDRRRQGRRAAAGPHGVRPAGARAPVDHRRPPFTRDAVDHEPEDQVPRVVPAVRTRGARRAGERVLRDRAGRRVAVHAARRRRPSRTPRRRRHDHTRGADLRTWVNEVRSTSPR